MRKSTLIIASGMVLALTAQAFAFGGAVGANGVAHGGPREHTADTGFKSDGKCQTCNDPWAPDNGINYSQHDTSNGGIGHGVDTSGALDGNDPGNMSGSGIGY